MLIRQKGRRVLLSWDPKTWDKQSGGGGGGGGGSKYIFA